MSTRFYQMKHCSLAKAHTEGVPFDKALAHYRRCQHVCCEHCRNYALSRHVSRQQMQLNAISGAFILPVVLNAKFLPVCAASVDALGVFFRNTRLLFDDLTAHTGLHSPVLGGTFCSHLATARGGRVVQPHSHLRIIIQPAAAEEALEQLRDLVRAYNFSVAAAEVIAIELDRGRGAAYDTRCPMKATEWDRAQRSGTELSQDLFMLNESLVSHVEKELGRMALTVGEFGILHWRVWDDLQACARADRPDMPLSDDHRRKDRQGPKPPAGMGITPLFRCPNPECDGTHGNIIPPGEWGATGVYKCNKCGWESTEPFRSLRWRARRALSAEDLEEISWFTKMGVSARQIALKFCISTLRVSELRRRLGVRSPNQKRRRRGPEASLAP